MKEDNKKRKVAQKERDPVKMREDDRSKQERHRQVQSEDQRLRSFLEDSLFGPIFVCLSCHQRHFKTNIQLFSVDAIKMPLERCIIDKKPLEKMNFGQVFTKRKGENLKIETQIIC